MNPGKLLTRFGAAVCLAAPLLLGACASSGTNFDPKLVDQLKPKVTQLDEAIRLLGNPNSVTKRADGTKVVQWIYFSIVMGSSTSKHVVVVFDQKDVLVQVVQQSQGKS